MQGWLHTHPLWVTGISQSSISFGLAWLEGLTQRQSTSVSDHCVAGGRVWWQCHRQSCSRMSSREAEGRLGRPWQHSDLCGWSREWIVRLQFLSLPLSFYLYLCLCLSLPLTLLSSLPVSTHFPLYLSLPHTSISLKLLNFTSWFTHTVISFYLGVRLWISEKVTMASPVAWMTSARAKHFSWNTLTGLFSSSPPSSASPPSAVAEAVDVGMWNLISTSERGTSSLWWNSNTTSFLPEVTWIKFNYILVSHRRLKLISTCI